MIYEGITTEPADAAMGAQNNGINFFTKNFTQQILWGHAQR